MVMTEITLLSHMIHDEFSVFLHVCKFVDVELISGFVFADLTH